MVLVIDNYDSFTYNLVQYLGELGADVRVVRNDAVSLEDVVDASKPDRIVISPGPGRPEEAGRDDERDSAASARRRRSSASASGIRRSARCSAARSCARACRCTARRRRSSTTAAACSAGIAGPFVASRYHSLVVAEEGLPAGARGDGADARGRRTIMGLRHRTWPVHGVQFHPESILTGEGRRILRNFLEGRVELMPCFQD